MKEPTRAAPLNHWIDGATVPPSGSAYLGKALSEQNRLRRAGRALSVAG